jgi:hypothetical protein
MHFCISPLLRHAQTMRDGFVVCKSWVMRHRRAWEKSGRWLALDHTSRRVYSRIVRPAGGDIRRPTIHVGHQGTILGLVTNTLFGRLGMCNACGAGNYQSSKGEAGGGGCVSRHWPFTLLTYPSQECRNGLRHSRIPVQSPGCLLVAPLHL